MKKVILTLITICVTSLVSAQNNKVVAIVGSKKITLGEFLDKYNKTDAMFNRPSPEVFLEDLIRFEMGAQEAEKRKYDQNPIIKQVIRQEMYKYLLEKELSAETKKIKVSEAEMKKEYQSSPEIRTSHILIELKPNANKKEHAIALKRAKEILKEVLASKKPFRDLVKIYTDDSFSKATGGDIGYQSRVTSFPTYYNAALKTKVGQIHRGVVETRYGFHIVKVTGQHTYDEADKRQLQAIVFDKKRKKVFDQFFSKLRKNYTVKTYKGNLKSVK